jgi:calcineurin-like phosphoesterase family protein
METFFISDTHFGHSNILKFSPKQRAFDTIAEHDEYIIQKWNETVKKSDRVFHLGDFAFGQEAVRLAKRLNGIKTLVAGNHDTYSTGAYLEAGFHKVTGNCYFDNCVLSHIPIHPGQLKHNKRLKYNLHGHMHQRKVQDTRYFNCAVEQINLTPINYDAIQSILQKQDNVYNRWLVKLGLKKL